MKISNEDLEVLNRAGEILSKYAASGGLTHSDLERFDNMVTSIIDAIGEKAFDERAHSVKANIDSILYSGRGDEVVALENLPKQHVFEVSGNYGKKYFGIIAYNSNARRLNAIVNTTDVYHGIVMERSQAEATLEIKCQGPWEIRVLPISELKTAQKGTVMTGIGDSVFVFSPEAGECLTAQISGNKGKKYFGVIGYNKDLVRIDAFVNTTAAYEGKVLLKGNPRVFEIKATGAWTVKFM